MPSKEKIISDNFSSDSSFGGDDYNDILSNNSNDDDDFLSPLELSKSGTCENIGVYGCETKVCDKTSYLQAFEYDNGEHRNSKNVHQILDFFSKKNTLSSEIYEYVIIRLLGFGYYGTVFLAKRSFKCKGLSNESVLVAVKIINFEKLENKTESSGGVKLDIIDQLGDEINILSTLNNHENVINYHESFFIKPHYLAFVTEYVSGYTLRDVYKSYGSFPETLIYYISESMLSVLVELDKTNYRYKRVHKDIKSTNIMIRYEDCKIKLLDFGVSQIIDTIVDNGTPRISSGTLQWMSPELFQIKEYDNLTDIWSLGITLLELSIGDIPKIHELFEQRNNAIDGSELVNSEKEQDIYSPKVSQSVIETYINMLNRDVRGENIKKVNKIRSFSKLFYDFLDKMLTVDLNKRWDCNRLINHPFILKHKSKHQYFSFQNLEKELYHFNNKFDISSAIRNSFVFKIYKNINNYLVKYKLNRSTIFYISDTNSVCDEANQQRRKTEERVVRDCDSGNEVNTEEFAITKQ